MPRSYATTYSDPSSGSQRGKSSSASSPGAFLPSDIPGLVLWLDADDATTFTFGVGTAVAQWNDKSGQGNHVSQGTAANQPIRTAAQLNGKPTVVFDGSNDVLSKSSATGFTGIANFTCYMVLNRTFTSSNRDIIQITGNGGGVIYRLRGVPVNSNFQWLTDANAAVTSTRAWGNVNQYYVRKTTYDGANQRYYFEGANDTDALTGNVDSDPPHTLLVGDGAAVNYAGGIAETLFWGVLLSATQQTQVETEYILPKWGI